MLPRETNLYLVDTVLGILRGYILYFITFTIFFSWYTKRILQFSNKKKKV